MGIGSSSYANFPSPSSAKTINSISGVVRSIIASYEFTLILLISGEVYVVGNNNNYQLGTGNIDTHLTPFLNPFLTDITGIGVGFYHSLFWNSSGLFGAGQNLVNLHSRFFFFILTLLYLF